MVVHPLSICLAIGDLIYLRIFGQGILFLNSVEATIEILEKRGAMYADRPRTVMLSELYVYICRIRFVGRSDAFLRCGCDNIVRTMGTDVAQRRTSHRNELRTNRITQVAFAGYSSTHYRQQRRLLHTALAPSSITAYQPLITTEISDFLRRLLDSPERYVDHIRRYEYFHIRDRRGLIMDVSYTGSQSMSIAYGYKVPEDNDPHIQGTEEAIDIIANHILDTPGDVWLVDLCPARTHPHHRSDT